MPSDNELAVKTSARRSTPSGEVRITIVSKLRNAGIHAAIKQVGSQAALAKRLGVRKHHVSRWYTMRACPPKEPRVGWTAPAGW
jgi:DNA-binding transcriptional regulator YiaG